jgi:16S rRNA (cytosine1402-N4)-methyltransferase
MSNLFFYHEPVMLKETIKMLAMNSDGVYVDGTFGNGGHTQVILESNPHSTVIAIDKDPMALRKSSIFKHIYQKRFTFINDCFSNIDYILKKFFSVDIKVKGIFLDLGISSIQIESPDRGFSFNIKSKLDMRMDNTNQNISADAIIKNTKEKELQDIFSKLGEEKLSKKIVKKIIFERNLGEINTVKLSRIIDSVKSKTSKQPSTKIFQALRIYVNNELDVLHKVLRKVDSVLERKGRIVVLSFHSLEDRIVKKFFSDNSVKSNHAILDRNDLDSKYRAIFQTSPPSPITPNFNEQAENPRSRSAVLRVGIKRSL